VASVPLTVTRAGFCVHLNITEVKKRETPGFFLQLAVLEVELGNEGTPDTTMYGIILYPSLEPADESKGKARFQLPFESGRNVVAEGISKADSATNFVSEVKDQQQPMPTGPVHRDKSDVTFRDLSEGAGFASQGVQDLPADRKKRLWLETHHTPAAPNADQVTKDSVQARIGDKIGVWSEMANQVSDLDRGSLAV